MLIIYLRKMYKTVKENIFQMRKFEGAYFKGPLKHKMGPINAAWGRGTKRRKEENFWSSSSCSSLLSPLLLSSSLLGSFLLFEFFLLLFFTWK